jgi:hypothetical protein
MFGNHAATWWEKLAADFPLLYPKSLGRIHNTLFYL